MTDKKLTDNEIKKGLECRASTGLRKINKCGKCKYVKNDLCNIRKLIMDALDLINRLQAENERLEEENKILKRDNNFNKSGLFNLLYGALVFTKTFEDYNKFKKDFKTEAYKECIEKVKALFPSCNEPYQYWEIHEGADNLLKEMVGEDNKTVL